MSPAPPIVLSFAASDPTGGAGLQADLLTLGAMGCHAFSVVTAVTAQDTRGVEAFLPVDAAWVVAQARCVLEDAEVSAFKLGVLGSAQNVTAIAEIIAEHPDIPLVLDPVLASGRGDLLAGDDIVAAMCAHILPRTSVVTPNSIEARRLAAGAEAHEPALEECARRLIALGCGYVLVTGTHEPGAEVTNTLYDRGGIVRADRWQRLPQTYHGSGCTLASAIAAGLAKGSSMSEAVGMAQAYTWQTLAHGFRPGAGQHLPDRLYFAREAFEHTIGRSR